MYTLGFLINPIAGMGGKVGLKGTDNVLNEAVKRGALPVAHLRASETLKRIRIIIEEYHRDFPVTWLTCSGEMGEDSLKEHGFSCEVVYRCKKVTVAEDTKSACRAFLKRNVDLIVFCGGDGTTRDIYKIVEDKIPILGIPSGVKMHSGVFCINPEAASEVIFLFTEGTMSICEAEIMDLDEEKYRKGEWSIKLHGIAKTLCEGTYIQSAKMMIRGPSEEEIKEEIADHITEDIEKDTLYILGSGGTLKTIGEKLGIDKTLLGIDAVFNGTLIAKDVNEKELLSLLSKYKKAKLIVSPIGAQGFILGRGNLQLSPDVLRKIGIENIIIAATPSKLLGTPFLRVDTGDTLLDKEFAERKYLSILIGYHTTALRKIAVPQPLNIKIPNIERKDNGD
ncbi:MAG: ATP-NAD kinase family protein [Methanomicrobia archaeon]|nr:ATP-NAD kinase family protein [Methanomicrobia archaeon]